MTEAHDRHAFAYLGIAPDGVRRRGVLEARSLEEARSLLSSQGLFTFDLHHAHTEQRQRTRISARDLGLGLRVLADLLDSGLPIARALAAFAELAPNAWQPALPELQDAVREGKSFAASLADCRLNVPALVIGIIKAGEAGTGLSTGARRAGELMEGAATTRSAIVAALVYPSIIALAGVIALSLLIGVVLPRFETILKDVGQAMPATTIFLLRASTAARASALPSIWLAVVTIVCWRVWTGTASGALRWADILRRLPVIGPVRHASSTARTAHSLSALLESGVPISVAIGLAARASGDAGIERRVLAARQHLSNGLRLSAALAREHAFTEVGIRLVRAGEESGRLAGMMAHLGHLEQDRAERVTRAAVRMLEPLLILVFAGLVALVAAALLQAVYSIRPT